MRILVVEDEPVLREQIGNALSGQNYTVDSAEDGEQALYRLLVDPYDLVLLDIMLPKKDGFGVLVEMRAEGIVTPVLMLTARGEVEDKVRGLDLGADDYLSKPFSFSELLARVRALLRRADQQHGSSNLIYGDIRLDTATREVFKADSRISLTPREFSILEFLLYNTDRVVSRFSMAEHVWGDAFDPFTMSNTIDVHIKNLRKKIGDCRGKKIQTVRGVGYLIRSSQSDENTE